MSRTSRFLVPWLFAVLAAWLVVLECLVVFAPDLDAGPVFGDYAHNVIEVTAGLLCLAGAVRASRERLAWALIGTGSGEDRAAEAARNAISSPLLEENVEGATGILLNITGGRDLGLFEVNEAAELIHSAADANSNIIFGAVIDEELGDEIRVTVIATGFDRARRSGGGYTTNREGRRTPDRGPRIDDRQRSSLEISDDEIDIPPFLR